jgi:uncharacterized membrane protein HdeD (DUF308 family)
MAYALTHRSAALVDDLRLRPRPVFLVGLAFLLVGAFVIGAPAVTGVALGGASAWLLWFAGVTILALWLVLLLGGRSITSLLIAGAAAAASGVFLFYNPRTGALAVAILVISALVMDGGVQLSLALKLRPTAVWRWLFASALASMAAALLLSAGSFTDADQGLEAFVGVALITSGLALVLFSRNASRRLSASPG